MHFTFSNPSSLSDLELIDRYRQNGDMDILGELFARYAHLIYGVCLKYLKNAELSKDATMQVFEILQQKIGQQDINNPGGWIHVVTKNHCLMELRSQQRLSEKQNLLVSDMEFELNEHHMIEVDDEVDLRILKACLAKLTVEQRKCLEMFYYDEKCYKHVANLTGYGLKRVKSYLQNGKRSLKICIEHNREKG
jgi:RNA polymerase sigma factor (sigma-70 family)